MSRSAPTAAPETPVTVYPATSRRRPAVVASLFALAILIAALAAVLNHEETSSSAPLTTSPTSTTTTSTSTTTTTIDRSAEYEAAFAAEVTRACSEINADPGLLTETVMQWNPEWSGAGRTRTDLQREINVCTKPARDAALARVAAMEEAARETSGSGFSFPTTTRSGSGFSFPTTTRSGSGFSFPTTTRYGSGFSFPQDPPGSDFSFG